MPEAAEARHEMIAHAIDLKARYFRLMDLKHWDEWEALFVADAVMDVRGEARAMAVLGVPEPPAEDLIWRGATTIRERVAGALGALVTVHHGHMGEVAEAEDGAIAATWAMEDRIRFPADAPGPIAGFNGFGHYHDRYVLTDAGWRIASVALSRLLIEPVRRETA